MGEKKRQWPVAVDLLYGQVKKSYRRRKLAKVERRMRRGTREAFKAKPHAPGLSHLLNTAFIERINLTVRRGIAALPRRSGSTWQTQKHLARVEASASRQFTPKGQPIACVLDTCNGLSKPVSRFITHFEQGHRYQKSCNIGWIIISS